MDGIVFTRTSRTEDGKWSNHIIRVSSITCCVQVELSAVLLGGLGSNPPHSGDRRLQSTTLVLLLSSLHRLQSFTLAFK